MSKPALRAVQPDEKPSPRKKHTVASAAKDGSELDLAYAIRDRLATSITGECSPRDLAALTKRLEDVVDRIKVLEAAAKKESDDSDAVGDEAFDATAI